jgi:hypothetical protein
LLVNSHKTQAGATVSGRAKCYKHSSLEFLQAEVPGRAFGAGADGIEKKDGQDDDDISDDADGDGSERRCTADERGWELGAIA